MKPLPHPARWAVAVLLLAPLFLLWPSVFGGRTYVPYDLAVFPPVSTGLTTEQLDAARDGANSDVTEVPIWFGPELELAGQAVRDGSLPQWNPYARAGTALMAHGLDGLLYPPNWLAMAHSEPTDGLWMLAYVNFALAGLLMYGFLRELRLGIVAALFGALIFAYSGTASANGHFYMRLASLVWLPGLLWASTRIAATQGIARAPGVIGLAGAMACTWLAGFPPYSAPVTLLAAGWCLFLVVREHRRDGGKPALLLAAYLLLGSLLGLGLAAAHLLPVFEFFPVSSRVTDLSLAHISGTAFDPMGLLGYLLPDAFGHPTLTTLPYDRSPLSMYLGSSTNWETGDPILPTYNFTEYTVFVGTLTLVLAVVGAFTGEARFRRFALLALLAVLLLAIAPWPLRYLYLLPGLQSLPPMRFVSLAALLLGALAAIGLEHLGDTSQRLQRILLIAVASLAALCAIGAVVCSSQDPPIYERLDVVGTLAEKYRAVNPDEIDRDFVAAYLRGPGGVDYLEQGRAQLAGNLWRASGTLALATLWIGLLPWLRRRRVVTGLALAALVVTFVELLSFGSGLNRGMLLPYSHDDTVVHEYLRQQRDRYRDSGGFMVARANSVPAPAVMLPPGTLGPDGIRDLNTYTFVDGRSSEPLRALYEPTHPNFLIREFLPQAFPDTEQLQRPLFDLLGVRYWLSVVPLQYGGTRVGPELAGPGGEFFIYERASPMPRAFMVPRLEILADDAAVTRALIAPDLDPAAAALVTPDQAELLGPWRPAGPGGARSIRFVDDRPGHVELEIDPGPAGYLVLADTALPGWSVQVDGTGVPMARADLFLRVIALPTEDRSRVTFRYATPGLGTGLILTITSGIALIALALLVALSRRRRAMVESPT